jgi:hypothetical protein
MTTTSRHFAAHILLVLLVLAAYWPGLTGGFLFDDFPNLVLDPDWKVTAFEWSQWRRAASEGIASEGGRGLALLSFAANHVFTGLDPWPMKLTNVLMHAGNGIVVLLICRRIFALARSFGPAPGDFAAWAIAAAWLLHPIQVSTVLYVVQRMEIGAQGFTLLALLFYLVARERQCAGTRSWPWLAGATVATLLGLGFKESALLTPLYAGLIELTLLRFKTHGGKVSIAWRNFYLLMVLSGALLFLFVVLPGYMQAESYMTRDFTLYERLITQPRMLCMYIGQILWPAPEQLVFYYDQVRASNGLLHPISTLWSILMVAALAVVAIAARNRRPLVTFGIGWFLVAHFLTSNVVPLELAFEHRNYLALFGALILVGGLFAGVARTWEVGSRRLVLLLAVVTLGGLTVLQSLTWSTPLGLAMSLASRNPGSIRASYDLGTEWLAMSADDSSSPLWNLAYDEFGNAAALPYGSGLGEQGQIIMLGRAGKPVPPVLWEQLRQKLARKGLSPEQGALIHSLVDCRVRSQCRFDDLELQKTLLQSVSDNPNSVVLRVQYSNFAYNAMADPELAIALMRDAIQLEPDNATSRAGLVKLLLASKLHSPEEVSRELAWLQASNTAGQLDAELAEIEALK